MSLVRAPSRQIQRIPSIALGIPFDEPAWLRASPQGSEYYRLPWTRQTYTFARTSAGGSVTGADGASIPAPTRGVPVIGMHDLDGDAVRERPGVRFTSSDVLDVDIAFELQQMALYWDLLATASTGPWFSVGDQTAPHLTLSISAAGKIRIQHHNGINAAVDVTMAVAAAAGKRLQGFGMLNPDGSVTLYSRTDSGSWVDEGDSGAPAAGIIAAPGAAIASVGTTGTDDFFHAKAILGTVYNQATIEAAF